MTERKFTVTDPRPYYKPMAYPQAFDFAEMQRQMIWEIEQINLAEDIIDWKEKLPKEEVEVYAFILNWFTQADVDVAASYFDNLAKWYCNPEFRILWARIANMESTHVMAYDMLPEQFGIPVSQYQEFLKVDEVYAQHEFMNQSSDSNSFETRVKTLMRHICGEGVALYGIFAMLANAQRFGQMKALGQEIVKWSSKDENLHVEAISWLLLKEFEENPHLVTEELLAILREMMDLCVKRGIDYMRVALSKGSLREFSLEDGIIFLKQLANARMEALNFGKLYTDVPEMVVFDWIGLLFENSSLVNFFEARSTNYAHGTLTGTWTYPPMDYLTDFDEAQRLANS